MESIYGNLNPPAGGKKRHDDEYDAIAIAIACAIPIGLSSVDAFSRSGSQKPASGKPPRINRLIERLDIPRKVTLNEAIELGKRFGTEESSSFINGLLDRIAVALEKP